VALGVKTAARRPGAKEGGREEEEKRSGIAAGRTDRLRSMENTTFAWSGFVVEEFPDEVATACVESMKSERSDELISSKIYQQVLLLSRPL
jgi:hypothetical protein